MSAWEEGVVRYDRGCAYHTGAPNVGGGVYSTQPQDLRFVPAAWLQEPAFVYACMFEGHWQYAGSYDNEHSRDVHFLCTGRPQLSGVNVLVEPLRTWLHWTVSTPFTMTVEQAQPWSQYLQSKYRRYVDFCTGSNGKNWMTGGPVLEYAEWLQGKPQQP